MQRRRWHEKAWGAGEGRGGGGGGDFWDVVSTLTQDLAKARNQLARLMKQVKPRLYGGGGCGDRQPPLQPIFRPPCTRAGSSLPPKCHSMCRKQWNPHYKSPPSPERPRPVTSAHHSCSRERAPPPSCNPRKRALWSFDQPLPQLQRPPNSCYKRPALVIVPEGEGEGEGFRICFNPRSRPRRCCCTLPALSQAGGGGGKRCLGTQYATLLEDVTSQLRERRLNRTPVDAESSNRTSCW